MLKLHFLGTSSGVPTRQRNVSGLALQRGAGAPWYLVDAGEGTQHRLQQMGLSLHDLAAVFITHAHGDHCYGLPGLLESAGMAQRQGPLTLVAPLSVWQWLQATRQLTDAPLPYAVEHVDVARHDTVLTQPGLAVTRHPLLHRVPSFAYRFAADETQTTMRVEALMATGLPRGPLWGRLQDGEDVVFNGHTLHSVDFVDRVNHQVAAVIGGDNADPTRLESACVGAQLLVHEATYTQEVLDKVGPGPMHSSAQAVAQFAQQVGLPNLVLTHFSARYHNPEGEAALLEEAQAHFTGNVQLAQDGDTFELSRDGQLTLIRSTPLHTP